MAKYLKRETVYEQKEKELQGNFVNPRASRKVANNTYLQRRGPGSIALLLHSTDVVTYHKDGRIVLNTGSWFTVTTKSRIRDGLPPGFDLYQDRGLWWLVAGKYWDKENPSKWLFKDGITIKGLKVTGHGGSPYATLKLRRQVRLYAKAYVSRLKHRKIDKPSSGDCWGCVMRTEDGQGAMGNDHYLNHIRENYFVPSLVVNALDWRGSQAEKSMVAEKLGLIERGWPESDWLWKSIERTITRFMYREMGLAS